MNKSPDPACEPPRAKHSKAFAAYRDSIQSCSKESSQRLNKETSQSLRRETPSLSQVSASAVGGCAGVALPG